jgi:hypothetical protein
MFEGRKRKKLESSGGKRAPATVVTAKRGNTMTRPDADPTHATYNWKLTVRVQPDDEPEFEAEVQHHFQAGSNLGPGMTLPVLYDPADHSNIFFDEGSAGGSAGTDGVAVAAMLQQMLDSSAPGQMEAPTSGFGPPPPVSPDPVVLLAQLAQLHEQGVVDDEEFAAQKARILGEAS